MVNFYRRVGELIDIGLHSGAGIPPPAALINSFAMQRPTQAPTAPGQPPVPPPTAEVPSVSVHSAMRVLAVLCEHNPSAVDMHANSLIRVINKLKEVAVGGSAAMPPPSGGSAGQTPRASGVPGAAGAHGSQSASLSATHNNYTASDTLCIAIRNISPRVLQLPDHKRTFLPLLVSFISSGTDIDVLMEVTRTMGRWVLGNNAYPPETVITAPPNTSPAATVPAESSVAVPVSSPATVPQTPPTPSVNPQTGAGAGLPMKEKLVYLLKMTAFERLDNPKLTAAYLDVVYRLLSIPSPQKAEWLQKLQRPALLGLRSTDATLRSRFLDIFNAHVGTTIKDRITWILTQDWDPLADHFWIQQALDVLLAPVAEKVPLITKDNFARVPSLTPGLGVGAKRQGTTLPAEMAEAARDQLSSHEEFLSDLREVTVKDWLNPLRELIHLDSAMARSMWVELFSALWTRIPKADQLALAKPFMTLLGKDYHLKQQQKRPNVIQCLLGGAAVCSPQPRVPAELLQYLAKTFNCWHIVIPMLEANVLSSPLEEKWALALAELYARCSEDDYVLGLKRRRCTSEESRNGLALVQHGLWSKAQEVFFQAMSRAQQTTGANLGAPPLTQQTKAELIVWEDQWIECAKRLNQWDVLAEFAKEANSPEMLLECSWKIQELNTLSDLLSKYAVGDNPHIKLCQAYLTLRDENFSSVNVSSLNGAVGSINPNAKTITEVELQSSQGVQMALSHWQQLPEALSCAHLPMLQLFQQFVELNESIAMLMDIKQTVRSDSRNWPEVKNVLNTWRDRLPNKADDITVWNEILNWRNYVFSIVANIVNNSANANPHILAILQDTPWTVIKFANIARKQNLPEVSVQSLSKLANFQNLELEVYYQENFSKITEQIKLTLSNPAELKTGLALISSLNVDPFTEEQKSEIFRLKGLLLMQSKSLDEANQQFSAAVQLSNQAAKSWLSWGSYCDKMFFLKKDISFAGNAIVCYMQGINNRFEKERLLLSRVLWLLGYDDDQMSLAKLFDKYNEHIPVWVWMMWLPQLFTSLSRPEAQQVKQVLLRLATTFPQALYYTLRAFYLEKREMPQGRGPEGADAVGAGARPPSVNVVPTASSGNPSVGVAGRPPVQAAWQMAEEVMTVLRRSGSAVAQSIEGMLEEIIVRFKPEPEEELLSAVHALLIKCYQLPANSTQEVPTSLRVTLDRVCKKFFAPETSQKSSKHRAFVAEYRSVFETDFSVSATVPATNTNVATANLQEVIQRLKKWKDTMQSRGNMMPNQMHLEDLSRHLTEFQSKGIEIPGQYFKDQEPIPDQHVTIDRFVSSVEVLHRWGFSLRRITMRGNDGKSYSFLVQFAIPHITRADERVMQLKMVINSLIERHKESRRRSLSIPVPVVVPVTPRVRLIQDHVKYISLAEVYDNFYSELGLDPEQPLLAYRDQLIPAGAPSMDPAEVVNHMQKSYTEICQSQVSEYILSGVIGRTFSSPDQLFVFKKQFTTQLALSSFLAHIMSIGDRAPHKILFCKSSGKILNIEFRPSYSSNGLLENHEKVPFRLTRNLEAFCTPFGVESLFPAVMVSTAQALMRREFIVRNFLCLFMRDDLCSWHMSKQPAAMEASQRKIEQSLQTRVSENVKYVLTRIKSLAPPQMDAGRRADGSAEVGEDETVTESPSSGPLNQVFFDLIQAATNPTNLCQMNCTWHPWF